jgi:hypothetical protein
MGKTIAGVLTLRDAPAGGERPPQGRCRFRLWPGEAWERVFDDAIAEIFGVEPDRPAKIVP